MDYMPSFMKHNSIGKEFDPLQASPKYDMGSLYANQNIGVEFGGGAAKYPHRPRRGKDEGGGGQICYTLSVSQENDMTQLQLAFAEIEKLPPDEQKEFAAWILEELHSEQRWAKLSARSGDLLSSLADEALREHKEKKTKKLDPETL